MQKKVLNISSYCFVIILLSERIWYLKLEKENWSLCADRFDSIYNFPHRLLNFIPKLEPFLSRHSITTRVRNNVTNPACKWIFSDATKLVPRPTLYCRTLSYSEASIHGQQTNILISRYLSVIYSFLASTTFQRATPIYRVSANWQLTYLYDRIRNVSYFLRSQ